MHEKVLCTSAHALSKHLLSLLVYLLLCDIVPLRRGASSLCLGVCLHLIELSVLQEDPLATVSRIASDICKLLQIRRHISRMQERRNTYLLHRYIVLCKLMTIHKETKSFGIHIDHKGVKSTVSDAVAAEGVHDIFLSHGETNATCTAERLYLFINRLRMKLEAGKTPVRIHHVDYTLHASGTGGKGAAQESLERAKELLAAGAPSALATILVLDYPCTTEHCDGLRDFCLQAEAANVKVCLINCSMDGYCSLRVKKAIYAPGRSVKKRAEELASFMARRYSVTELIVVANPSFLDTRDHLRFLLRFTKTLQDFAWNVYFITALEDLPVGSSEDAHVLICLEDVQDRRHNSTLLADLNEEFRAHLQQEPSDYDACESKVHVTTLKYVAMQPDLSAANASSADFLSYLTPQQCCPVQLQDGTFKIPGMDAPDPENFMNEVLLACGFDTDACHTSHGSSITWNANLQKLLCADVGTTADFSIKVDRSLNALWKAELTRAHTAQPWPFVLNSYTSDGEYQTPPSATTSQRGIGFYSRTFGESLRFGPPDSRSSPAEQLRATSSGHYTPFDANGRQGTKMKNIIGNLAPFSCVESWALSTSWFAPNLIYSYGHSYNCKYSSSLLSNTTTMNAMVRCEAYTVSQYMTDRSDTTYFGSLTARGDLRNNTRNLWAPYRALLSSGYTATSPYVIILAMTEKLFSLPYVHYDQQGWRSPSSSSGHTASSPVGTSWDVMQEDPDHRTWPSWQSKPSYVPEDSFQIFNDNDYNVTSETYSSFGQRTWRIGIAQNGELSGAFPQTYREVDFQLAIQHLKCMSALGILPYRHYRNIKSLWVTFSKISYVTRYIQLVSRDRNNGNLQFLSPRYPRRAYYFAPDAPRFSPARCARALEAITLYLFRYEARFDQAAIRGSNSQPQTVRGSIYDFSITPSPASSLRLSNQPVSRTGTSTLSDQQLLSWWRPRPSDVTVTHTADSVGLKINRSRSWPYRYRVDASDSSFVTLITDNSSGAQPYLLREPQRMKPVHQSTCKYASTLHADSSMSRYVAVTKDAAPWGVHATDLFATLTADEKDAMHLSSTPIVREGLRLGEVVQAYYEIVSGKYRDATTVGYHPATATPATVLAIVLDDKIEECVLDGPFLPVVYGPIDAGDRVIFPSNPKLQSATQGSPYYAASLKVQDMNRAMAKTYTATFWTVKSNWNPDHNFFTFRSPWYQAKLANTDAFFTGLRAPSSAAAASATHHTLIPQSISDTYWAMQNLRYGRTYLSTSRVRQLQLDWYLARVRPSRETLDSSAYGYNYGVADSAVLASDALGYLSRRHHVPTINATMTSAGHNEGTACGWGEAPYIADRGPDAVRCPSHYYTSGRRGKLIGGSGSSGDDEDDEDSERRAIRGFLPIDLFDFDYETLIEMGNWLFYIWQKIQSPATPRFRLYHTAGALGNLDKRTAANKNVVFFFYDMREGKSMFRIPQELIALSRGVDPSSQRRNEDARNLAQALQTLSIGQSGDDDQTEEDSDPYLMDAAALYLGISAPKVPASPQPLLAVLTPRLTPAERQVFAIRDLMSASSANEWNLRELMDSWFFQILRPRIAFPDPPGDSSNVRASGSVSSVDATPNIMSSQEQRAPFNSVALRDTALAPADRRYFMQLWRWANGASSPAGSSQAPTGIGQYASPPGRNTPVGPFALPLNNAMWADPDDNPAAAAIADSNPSRQTTLGGSDPDVFLPAGPFRGYPYATPLAGIPFLDLGSRQEVVVNILAMVSGNTEEAAPWTRLISRGGFIDALAMPVTAEAGQTSAEDPGWEPAHEDANADDDSRRLAEAPSTGFRTYWDADGTAWSASTASGNWGCNAGTPLTLASASGSTLMTVTDFQTACVEEHRKYRTYPDYNVATHDQPAPAGTTLEFARYDLTAAPNEGTTRTVLNARTTTDPNLQLALVSRGVAFGAMRMLTQMDGTGTDLAKNDYGTSGKDEL